MAEQQVEPAVEELLRIGFRTVVIATQETIVVRLQGQLDLATAPRLAEVLAQALDAHPATITLDLTDLTFLDSSGIHQLVNADKRARSRRCDFSLRSPRRQVLKALQLTGVDRFITIDGSFPPP